MTTSPGNNRMPKQRIKIEVANIPAYTSNLLTLSRNYDFLPNGYDDTLLNVEKLEEIMADKLVAFPACTSHIRHRDIWDLRFLMGKGAKLDTGLVKLKIADYGIGNFEELLDSAIDRLPGIIRSEAFALEMKRFVPADAWAETFDRGEWWFERLTHRTTRLFGDLRDELHPKVAPVEVDFF